MCDNFSAPVFFTMILYFELTANCSLIRSETSVWKVCVKKYGFFYEDEDDTSVHDNPEVIDLEFMQYAKNDISALLDQSEAGNVDKDLTELEKDVKKVDKDVPKVNKNVKTSNKKEKQVIKVVKEVEKDVKGVQKDVKEMDKDVKELAKDGERVDRSRENSRNCSEETKVAFAKTHKTGSTTVQNILFRFGEQRRLSFVLPKARD